MGTSEPVRAPPEVSRTRGHRLAKPRQIALSSKLGHSNPRSRAGRWVLAARSWDFLSLPNFAPEVFVHARRHVFVVRMRDVFAYRLRVLEAVTANAAMRLGAGEDVRTPLGAFRVVFGIGHLQILATPHARRRKAIRSVSATRAPFTRSNTTCSKILKRYRC